MDDYPLIKLPDSPDVNGEDRAIVTRIVNPTTGRLRASKPPVTRVKGADGRWRPERQTGIAAWVWRMVAFQASPNPKHHCMPVLAFCDLPTESCSPEEQELIRRLEGLVTLIVDSIPKAEWHGIKRWGQAMGRIGTPRYNDGGAVIYR